MASVYANWERLVREVLRRDQQRGGGAAGSEISLAGAMFRSNVNWERLVREVLRREQQRGGGAAGLAGPAPASLGKTTNIDAILQASHEIEDEDPHVARILCEQAYCMAQNLDPSSEGIGVLQFKTGLTSVMKQQIAKRGGTTIDRQRDIEHLWKFYLGYKRRDRVDDIQKEQQRLREFGTFRANLAVVEAKAAEMKKFYTTLRALIDALEVLVGNNTSTEVGRTIMEEVKKIKKSESSIVGVDIEETIIIASEDLAMSGGFSLFKKKEEPSKFGLGFSLFKKKEEPSKFGLAPIFKYKELKKATNNFSTEIGDGGFGRVYHGKLRDGRDVAIKELFERNPNRLEQFLNEVTVFSRLHHDNLINLYGCSDPRDHKLFLVYDYVPNGTVEDHLHGQRSNLTLSLRIQIAAETAEALAYLHALKPLVVHRDVKTANILLDNAFHVKVADLGICRPLPFDATNVLTVQQGTVGYRDPEYDEYLKLSDKSDVYSFGVVLMELVSGQKAVDIYRDPIYLVRLVLIKKLEEIVDLKLGYQSNGDVKSIIDSVAQLARKCLRRTGDMRPSMPQVLSVLKEIQNKMA